MNHEPSTVLMQARRDRKKGSLSFDGHQNGNKFTLGKPHVIGLFA